MHQSRCRFAQSLLTTLAAALTVLALGAGHYAAAQTTRSTLYTGSGGVQYAAEARFNTSVAMTLEAWVFRQDENRCETIIAQDSANSFSLGFCFHEGMTGLKFSRSGSVFAFGSTNVRANVWTHVAAVKDGATLQLYLNGVLAASTTTATSPLVTDDTEVGIGAGSNGAPFWAEFFHGRLDDLRFYAKLARQEGVLLDPAYCGKAFRGMLAELRKTPDRFGRQILFLHSGGVFSFEAYRQQFARVLRSARE